METLLLVMVDQAVVENFLRESEALAHPAKATRVGTLDQVRAAVAVARALSGRLVARVGQTLVAMVAQARHRQLRALQ